MQVTVKEIIKVLPFEEQFKNELLQNLDTYPSERRYEISQIVWDIYFTLYQVKLESNIEQALEQVELGQREFGSDFYKEMQEQTQKEMQEEFASSVTKVDLSDTRKKLEELMQTADKPGPN